jgi:hypothetical protein
MSRQGRSHEFRRRGRSPVEDLGAASGDNPAGDREPPNPFADVDPWTTVFNPGVSTLDRLVELTREVDFAAFVFAQHDWTTKGASPDAASGQASPRDNVVFEVGLFGGALGIRRTFILRYWSEASKERVGPASIFYFWKGERPRHPNAPQLEGTGEIKLESVDRAGGYFTTRSDGADAFQARTSGIYLRANPGDMAVLDGNDAAERAALIERRLEEWTSLSNS